MNGRRVLVVAAHPDDEVLGCGGTVRKWSNLGAHVKALVLAQGVAARSGVPQEALPARIEELRSHAKESSMIIGYEGISFEDYPDNRMDSADLLDIVRSVERCVEDFRPHVVLTHHHGDLNIDHRICCQAVLTACRPLPGSPVCELLCFETPSSTEWGFPYYKNGFSPNCFIDISDTIEAKIDGMNCYKTEVRPSPHPRSPEQLYAIARRWGGVVGSEYAEAFEQVFRID